MTRVYGFTGMSRKGDFAISIQSISPRLAAEILRASHGINVRNLDWKWVERYARDMAAGKWTLSTQTLLLNRLAQAINGQHTLHAIVVSGVTVDVQVRMRVAGKDLPSDVDNLDGGKTRAAGDNLGPGGRALAARSRVIWHLATGETPPSMSTPQIRPLTEVFSAGLQWAQKTIPGKQLLASAPAAGALAFAYARDPEAIADLVRRFRSADPTGASDPAAHLLRFFMSPEAHAHNGARWSVVAQYVLAAAKAAVSGDNAASLCSPQEAREFFLAAYNQKALAKVLHLRTFPAPEELVVRKAKTPKK